MFRRIMLKIKERTGISVTTELIILIVVIVGIAVSVGDGLTGVFIGSEGVEGSKGVVDKLEEFVTKGFNGAIGDISEG